jgi:hypothetical protein
MKFTRIFFVAAMALFTCTTVRSQSNYLDNRPRFLFDTEIGTQTALGYELPSVTIGPAMEIPVGNRFELQADSTYSPDRKKITNDGYEASVGGSAIGFATERLGFIGGLERGWLWTSEFDKKNLFPTAGIVMRNNYFGKGRFYLTYTFPTGCVWATPTNPCTIQSNRLQGITVRQETRSPMHTRWGLQTGVYHFCDEANPNVPETRKCHIGVTAMATMSFEFHLGGRPRIASAAGDADNF